MRYFGDREERHGAKLLKEIKGMFESMTKVFMDMKDVCQSKICSPWRSFFANNSLRKSYLSNHWTNIMCGKFGILTGERSTWPDRQT